MTFRPPRASTATQPAIALLAVAILAASSTASGALAPAAPSYPGLDSLVAIGAALAAEPTPASAIAAAQALLQQRAALLPHSGAAVERGLRDLQAAADVVAAVDAGGDEVAQAVRLAAIASGRAGAVDFAPAAPRHALPSEALLALLELNGASADPASLTAFDTLAEPLRGDLALLVDTFIAFEGANIQAGAGSADGLASILSARQGFLDSVVAFQESILAASALPCVGPLAVAPAFSIELGDCPATSYCNPAIDYILLIDEAGNDKYCNNAGGNAGPLGGCVFFSPPAFPAAALLDITGDDEYVPDDNGAARDCGVNGGGFDGSGLLVDVFGDDTYTAGGHGVNGGALSDNNLLTPALGIPSTGALIDVFGNDDYVAGWDATNGGGSIYTVAGNHPPSAVGLLLDITGSDTYTAGGGGTNGGAWGDSLGEALGALLDVAGDDTYTAESVGVNGGGYDGAGFLVDVLGNDDFDAEHFGVNGGAYEDGYASNGLLVDGTEDDTYTALGFGVNGGAYDSGSHPAIGILVDVLGNDQYTATGGGTNGGAEATPWVANTVTGSFGFLVDAQGNDVYTDNVGFGTNGGGHAPAGALAVGTLVDVGFGIDTYNGPLNVKNGQNGAGDGGSGIGLLVDIGGIGVGGVGDKYCDAYNPVGCGVDATVQPKSTTGLAGAQLDQ